MTPLSEEELSVVEKAHYKISRSRCYRLIAEVRESRKQAKVLLSMRASSGEGQAILKAIHDGKRSCNLHDDCDVANAKAKAAGKFAEHCHDDCCPDCFGQ